MARRRRYPMQSETIGTEETTELIEDDEGIDLDSLVRNAGLIYHDHHMIMGRRPDGTDGMIWTMTQRPMTGGDILSWRRNDDGSVIIVTMDGGKHRLEE